jgi:hypothetical protein
MDFLGIGLVATAVAIIPLLIKVLSSWLSRNQGVELRIGGQKIELKIEKELDKETVAKIVKLMASSQSSADVTVTLKEESDGKNNIPPAK